MENWIIRLVPCSQCTICDLWILADNIINFLIFKMALPILVLAILIGGFVWMTSAGNPERIGKGKKILTSSIVGIFIAFGGWLIVDTIIKTFANEGAFAGAWNKIQECPAPIVAAPPVVKPPITFPEGTFQTEDEARAYFKNLGFTDAALKPPCQIGQTTGCLNLAGLPKNVADKLWNLKTQCGALCPFRISSGTEGGHFSHGVGRGIVDIVPIKTTAGAMGILRGRAIQDGKATTARCEAQGGAPVSDCGSAANHVHVVFPY